MRRWFAILLLAMLPLQFSWAAVATYCTHETDKVEAQHFGHHAHEHAADHADESNPAKKLPGAADPDCLNCHGQIAALPDLSVPMNAIVHPSSGPAADTHWQATFAPDRPERPQWARFA
jgi:hypothetical protein